MEKENENVVEEVKQVEIKEPEKENTNTSNNKTIIKIVIGILVFLAVVGIAVFLLFHSIASNALGSITEVGKTLINSAKEDVSDDISKAKENLNNVVSNAAKNAPNTKVAITADKFSEIMKAKGYEVIDCTYQFAQYGDYAKKVYAAKKDNYQIEFFELDTEQHAIDSYNTNKANFESQKENISSYFTLSKNNYNTYALTTAGKYKYVARVDKTMLFLNVDESYKDVVKDIVNKLGY